MADFTSQLQEVLGFIQRHFDGDVQKYLAAVRERKRAVESKLMHGAATGIEARLCELIRQRQQTGVRKYGRTLADYPACRVVRVRHALEEACDLAAYLLWELEAAERESTCTCNDCCPAGACPDAGPISNPD